MNPFAGKSPTERNKIIAAMVLGALSLFSLWFAFGGSFSSSKPKITVNASPSPKPSASPGANNADLAMPTANELDALYATIPVIYNPNTFYAPDAGRNIFAFYEPPLPTPPLPVVPVVKTPTPIPPPPPTPEPPMKLDVLLPQSVYAGGKGFRLEVVGQKFTPDSRIYFAGAELRTTFVSPEKLFADVPANLIGIEGDRQIIVQTPDGKLYSNQFMLSVQAPPRPQFQYIGMIARRGYNNDTAYFQEQSKPTPFGARLNDVVAGRFRVFSISANEIILEDVSLGFKHKLPLYRPAPGQTASAPTTPPTGRRVGNPVGIPNDGSFQQYSPSVPTIQQQQDIPGIPNNIPRYVPPGQQPPQPQRTPAPQKQDVDDDDDDGDGRN
jgi:hypothetical protein